MDNICGECGSAMILSAGKGRFRTYRGKKKYEMPEDLVFWACFYCGAELMTSSQIDYLDDYLKAQHAYKNKRGHRKRKIKRG